MRIVYWLPVGYSVGLVTVLNAVPYSTAGALFQGIIIVAGTVGMVVGLRWNRWNGIPVISSAALITVSMVGWWLLYLSGQNSSDRFWSIALAALYSVFITGWYAAMVFIPARSRRLLYYRHWLVASALGSIVVWALALWTASEPILFLHSFEWALGVIFCVASLVLWINIATVSALPFKSVSVILGLGGLVITILLWFPIAMGVRLGILLILLYSVITPARSTTTPAV